jgi:hypothetical protein
MRRCVASCLLVSCLVLGAAAGAREPVRPKAGGYAGKVTNANGKGSVSLVVATFVSRPGAKPHKGPQLVRWRGVLKCADGSSREVGPGIFAPLHGARFNGRSKTGAQTTTLRGRFLTRTRLKAAARVVTTGGGPATRCDTGPVRFKAHRR